MGCSIPYSKCKSRAWFGSKVCGDQDEDGGIGDGDVDDYDGGDTGSGDKDDGGNDCNH